jgi:hypothetical protein
VEEARVGEVLRLMNGDLQFFTSVS